MLRGRLPVPGKSRADEAYNETDTDVTCSDTPELLMKLAIAAIVIGFSSGAYAAPAPSLFSQLSLTKAITSGSVFQTKGRSGSHRVGGSGRSGKGGHYEGRRK
jgi:hypothetical protein